MQPSMDGIREWLMADLNTRFVLVILSIIVRIFVGMHTNFLIGVAVYLAIMIFLNAL